MNSKEYTKNVLVTEARDFAPVINRITEIKNLRLIHASVGITSEVAELFQLERKSRSNSLDRTNLLEECGDILWYVAIAADALDKVDEIMAPTHVGVSYIKFDDDLGDALFTGAAYLSEVAGTIADLAVKKLVFYGKPFDTKLLVEQLFEVHMNVKFLLDAAGYSIEDARLVNIAKLKARYGEKFSEAAALERNLDLERQILEGK
jgi:hypothetical protein